ncbi:MAG: hypothetical protein AAF268_02410, partial [Cyanobacteria bacterium P01_A01_bin.3]
AKPNAANSNLCVGMYGMNSQAKSQKIKNTAASVSIRKQTFLPIGICRFLTNRCISILRYSELPQNKISIVCMLSSDLFKRTYSGVSAV